MSYVYEITWYGRGGLGAKTGSILLAESAIMGNKFVQAFPEYGPERQGAPMKVYNRISDKKIRIHTAITKSDFIIVIDPTLLNTVNYKDELKPNGKILINTEKSPSEIREMIKLDDKGIKIYTLDATDISIKYIGSNKPNVPILAGFSKITGLIELDVVKDNIKDKFKNRDDIIKSNIEALDNSYNGVKNE